MVDFKSYFKGRKCWLIRDFTPWHSDSHWLVSVISHFWFKCCPLISSHLPHEATAVTGKHSHILEGFRYTIWSEKIAGLDFESVQLAWHLWTFQNICGLNRTSEVPSNCLTLKRLYNRLDHLAWLPSNDNGSKYPASDHWSLFSYWVKRVRWVARAATIDNFCGSTSNTSLATARGNNE